MWTLVYNGQEKTLASWGIAADVEREQSSKQKGSFRCRTVEGFDAGAPQFAYRTAMTVWRDRVSIGSGGTIYFQGYWDDGRRVCDGGKQQIEYVAYDVWWLFERQIFMQQRRQFNGTSTHIPTGTFVYNWVLCPEVYLGELIDNTASLYLQSNGDQVVEVVKWVNETYNPTRRGAVGGWDTSQDVVQVGTPDTRSMIPVERANGLYCAEAIIRVLRLSPDALVWIDYSTTPPTLKVRTFGKWNYGTNPPTFVDYTNLPLVTLTITAEQEKQIWIQAQHGAQLSGVAIYYRWMVSVDGVTAPVMQVDKYPVGITDYTPEVSRHLIELQGMSLNHAKADIQVNDAYPLSMLGGSAANKVAWLLAHDQTLNDAKIDASTITVVGVSVVDGSGAAVNLTTYPNELISTTLPKWTGCSVIHATVQAEVSFTKYSDVTHKVKEVGATARVIRHGIKLTNATTRTYEAVSHYDPGETAPAGVAEQAFRGVAALQNAVGITFVAGQLRSDIQVGCRMTLIGPTTTFSNILVQSVRERPHFGETIVNGGPVAAVDIDALIALARASRWRTIYNMPSHRDDGAAGGSGANMDMGADAPAENTAHGVGGNKFHGVTFQQS